VGRWGGLRMKGVEGAVGVIAKHREDKSTQHAQVSELSKFEAPHERNKSVMK